MGESDVPLDPDEDGVELCDGCGAVVDDDTMHLALVRDSSAIHADNPRFDGQRMVQVCSTQCFERVRAEYARRPWRRREQWTGKVIRAIEHAGGRASREQVMTDTGLSRWQIKIASWYSQFRLIRQDNREKNALWWARHEVRWADRRRRRGR